MKDRPILFSGPMVRAILDGRKTQTRRVCKGQRELSNVHDFQLDRCPFGKPGDRLWVRECFRDRAIGEGGHHERGPYVYRATENVDGLAERWRPSIHMPRWASRITLEIVSVRVERLNDISEADALAEGMTVFNGTVYSPHEPEGKNAYTNARGAFGSLWESINGAGSWAANPWVWGVEFRRLP